MNKIIIAVLVIIGFLKCTDIYATGDLTPLATATCSGRLQEVQRLLDQKGDPNESDSAGSTLLMKASH